MKPKVYVETTVISYLAARPSRDLIIAAHQQITEVWWFDHRQRFDLFISPLVVAESRGGDRDASDRRMHMLAGLPMLHPTEQSESLAESLVASGAFGPRALADAAHVAIASVHQMDFLVTWNLKHLGSALSRKAIGAACRAAGFVAPAICTPEELSEE